VLSARQWERILSPVGGLVMGMKGHGTITTMQHTGA